MKRYEGIWPRQAVLPVSNYEAPPRKNRWVRRVALVASMGGLAWTALHGYPSPTVKKQPEVHPTQTEIGNIPLRNVNALRPICEVVDVTEKVDVPNTGYEYNQAAARDLAHMAGTELKTEWLSLQEMEQTNGWDTHHIPLGVEVIVGRRELPCDP